MHSKYLRIQIFFNMKLPLSFYKEKNIIEIAKKLLGKFLFTYINGRLEGGMIVETESYGGIKDKACHAYNGRFTERTKTMYEEGGVSYIYLCYGMYNLFNVVTNKSGIPEAILIRALEPLTKNKKDLFIASGPGKLCKALNITRDLNNVKLNSSKLWIEDRKIEVEEKNIIKSKRVGIDYAEEDAFLPWRFRIRENKFTSKAK
jgi:DNA-3-methyladenine glycosylase